MPSSMPDRRRLTGILMADAPVDRCKHVREILSNLISPRVDNIL